MSRLRAACCTALVAAAVVPADQAAGANRFERAVIGHVNDVRAAHGLNRLRKSGRLSAAAARHSRAQVRMGRLTHHSGSGSPFQRLNGRKRGKVGETIAFVSRRSARRVVRMWMRSSSHRAVLLAHGFRRIGMGAVRGRVAGSRGTVVTADFAARR